MQKIRQHRCREHYFDVQGGTSVRNFFHQFFFLLDEKAKKKMVKLLMFFIVSSLLDVVGLSLIGVFLALLLNPNKFLTYLPSNDLIQEEQLIYISGTLIILSFLMKTVLNSFIQKRLVATSFGYNISLKMRLISTYQYVPY